MFTWKRKLLYKKEEIDELVSNSKSLYTEFFKKQAELSFNQKFILKKRKNGDLTALCPCHRENTPSLRIKKTTGVDGRDYLTHFKCFGCGKAGTIISLIQEVYGVNFFNAVKIIKQKNYTVSKLYAPGQRPDWRRELRGQKPQEENDDDLPF